MLYTTQEIAKKYSSEENIISAYMITHTWIPQGLKHIRGKKNSYLYKLEWVDEFLETQAIINLPKVDKSRKPIIRKLPRNCNLKVV